MKRTMYCTICRKELKEEAFRKSIRHLNRSQCSKCNSKIGKEKYDPLKEKDTKLRRLYSITLADMVKLAEDQDYKCIICFKQHPRTLMNNGLVVDHCHTSGKIRGLLCHNCNLLLGKANEDVNILLSAIKYLSKT